VPPLYQVIASALAVADAVLAVMIRPMKVTGWALNSWLLETMTRPSFDLECWVHVQGHLLRLPRLSGHLASDFPSTSLAVAVPTIEAGLIKG